MFEIFKTNKSETIPIMPADYFHREGQYPRERAIKQGTYLREYLMVLLGEFDESCHCYGQAREIRYDLDEYEGLRRIWMNLEFDLSEELGLQKFRDYLLANKDFWPGKERKNVEVVLTDNVTGNAYVWRGDDFFESSWQPGKSFTAMKKFSTYGPEAKGVHVAIKKKLQEKKEELALRKRFEE